MTKSTANSDYALPPIGGEKGTMNVNVEDPNAELQLNEEEL